MDFFDGEKIATDAEIKALYQEDESNMIGQLYNEQRKNTGRRGRQYWERSVSAKTGMYERSARKYNKILFACLLPRSLGGMRINA